MEVKIKLLSEDARMPTLGSAFAAGADLYALTGGTVEPGGTLMVGTGIAIEIPEGYVGLVCARSGLSTKKGLAPANKVGVIDSDYRGEIKVALFNHSKAKASFEAGERIAQLVIVPYLKAEFVVSTELEATARGDGGFGSSGKK